MTVDPDITAVLIDLAIRLDDQSRHPVDVEHVVAAIVIAARRGELDHDTPLAADDEATERLLARRVAEVFDRYGHDLDPDER